MAQLKIDDVVLGEVEDGFADYLKQAAQGCGPGRMPVFPQITLREPETRTLGYYARGALTEVERIDPIEVEFRLEFDRSRREMTRTVPRWAY